jgi:hypothetical protein
MGEYYTAIVMYPRQFRIIDYRDVSLQPTSPARAYILYQSLKALTTIWEHTREIAQYIDEMLGIGEDILLDAKKHDGLLFDDETFSRSRKYWWAANMLPALKENIQGNLRAHNEFLEDFIEHHIKTPRPEQDPHYLHGMYDRGKEVIAKLEKLIEQFESQRERTELLRNGVCSLYPIS